MAKRTGLTLDPLAEKLRTVHTIPELVQYLHDELNWPVNVDDWEDNLFDWQPDELNLKAEHEVKIKSIKQLRPLVSGQPWGIFFVEFAKGRLPITALRRVLNGLVPKGRATDGSHQTWAAHDLLFVSSFGESNAREIALAHFTDESSQGDLPTLRVLGWDDDDTPMQLGYVAQTLRDKLRWPANTRTAEDLATWRSQWSSAFSLRYGQVINDSKTLALAMAELAKRIRRRVNTVLALENESGHLRQMHKAFRDNLIADLSDDAFADMFAQTITYGLFTARASRESGALVANNLADMVPSTNPFLKELLGSFLSAAGRARSSAKRVDFDELGINEVVTVLREVPMDAVLRSFNATKPGDDPVIHFYEDFLKAYDKAMRAKRGVFYTPSPVVQFIVRGVDEILKAEFDIEDGLASTTTWGEVMARKPELKLPKFCTASTPFVQVLDPATGTGTFVVEVITHIHAHMIKKWAKQGKVTKAQWQPLWVNYVKQHLLPRLYAFELMMAPYAIAHMKIGLKLAETGYTFPEDGPRVNVFLTNALEPAHAINPGLAFDAPMLAHEAAAANRVKEQLAATVLVGNPPYSGESGNQGEWITQLMRTRLADGADSFFRFNDAELGERNPKWVNNDYVKFFRLAQARLATLGTGVIGYITSNSYLESPTFRGVRQSLLHTLPHLRIVDLHGNSKRGETAGGDENVFEITEGVAIAIGNVQPSLSQNLQHADLIGVRESKYENLLGKGLSLLNPFRLSGDWLYLVRTGGVDIAEFERGWKITEVMPLNNTGIVTKRDGLAIQFDKSAVQTIVRDIYKMSCEEIVSKYPSASWESRDGKVEFVKDSIMSNGVAEELFVKCHYRPFDHRWTYYTKKSKGFIAWPVYDVMRHLQSGKNLAMSVGRQGQAIDDSDWQVLHVSRQMTDFNFYRRGGNNLFPLLLCNASEISINFSQAFVSELLSALSLSYADYRPADIAAPLYAEKIFNYIYAVLHSPDYRKRYAAFLRTDFPRVPIPGSRTVFEALSQLGSQLVAWHLLEHPDAVSIVAGQDSLAGTVAWFGKDFALSKVAEKSRALADVTGADDKVGKVFINASSGFANVHEAVWLHTIGGYQVLHKWLDDRRKAGRSLSQDDITHWLRVYAALQATQNLMLQVDDAIEASGGWPNAFSQNHPPPDAASLAAEQMAQKEQLKAQKKAAAADKKKGVQVSPTGASSLFDFDDDLDALAAASGAPPRPKAKATPVKAVGGKTASRPAQAGLNDGHLMCAIRRCLAVVGVNGLSRDVLIRLTSRELGFTRASASVKTEIDAAIRRAVRRGVAQNAGGVLSLMVRDIDGYKREHLKVQLLASIRAAGKRCSKAEAPLLLARALGFARTGSGIKTVVESLLRSLIRSKLLEANGDQLRVL